MDDQQTNQNKTDSTHIKDENEEKKNQVSDESDDTKTSKDDIVSSETESPKTEEKPVTPNPYKVPANDTNSKDSSIKDIFGQERANEDFYPLEAKAKTVGESHIEVQQYDIPSKSTDDNQEDAKADSQPVHHQLNTSRSISIATTFSILILVLGFGGGFLSFQNWSKITSLINTSADEVVVDTASKTPVVVPVTPAEIEKEAPIETVVDPLKDWSSYTNTKFAYSVKFPDNWFGQNTTNAAADTISLTSVKPTSEEVQAQIGYKVEIRFQNSNSKLLPDWIKDNNTVGGYGAPKLTALKIDGKDAYQETITTITKFSETYVFQADKVMVVSYFAPEKDFDAGLKFYQDIIGSIKLQ